MAAPLVICNVFLFTKICRSIFFSKTVSLLEYSKVEKATLIEGKDAVSSLYSLKQFLQLMSLKYEDSRVVIECASGRNNARYNIFSKISRFEFQLWLLYNSQTLPSVICGSKTILRFTENMHLLKQPLVCLFC